MPLTIGSLLLWLLLFLVQLLAALPWASVLFTTPEMLANVAKTLPTNLRLFRGLRLIMHGLAGVAQQGLIGVAALIGIPMLGLFLTQRDWMETVGGVYAGFLQLQLTFDFFIVFFFVLLAVWPKGGAVALAAFREGVRQPMFWLLVLFAWVFLTVTPFVPYFTFGEDYTVVKELGFDTLMLAAILFGTLAASIFIAEEIEGRTAVTVMSKPISRRQFLLGKFLGITLAAMLLYGMLATYFAGVLDYKYWWDKSDPVPPAPWVADVVRSTGLTGPTYDLLIGIGRWVNHMLELVPGLILSFCQVMVLVAVAVTLATRVPMVVNMSIILVLYLAAHLTPVLVSIGQRMQLETPGPVAQIVSFTSQLFDTLLPGLAFLKAPPALIGETSMVGWEPFSYVGNVAIYAVMYTAIVLLVGLILFEDRDLA
jgi:ABC-type transport system involved in multi-copper enzyme maturation permease subunit